MRPGKETIVLVISVFLFLLTVALPEWIEVLGFDPDHGDGSAELLIAAALAVSSCVFGARVLMKRVRA